MERPNTSHGHSERRSTFSNLLRPRTGYGLQSHDERINPPTPLQHNATSHSILRRNTFRARGVSSTLNDTPYPREGVTYSRGGLSDTTTRSDDVASNTLQGTLSRQRRPSFYESSSAEIKSMGRSTARRVGKLSTLFAPKAKDTASIENEGAHTQRRYSDTNGWLKRARSTTFRFGRKQGHEEAEQHWSSAQSSEASRLPSWREGILEPTDFRGGAAARAAAAAASRERSESLQAPLSREVSRLRDLDLSTDSESGIGIDLKDTSEDDQESVSTVTRLDPACLPPELFEHIMSHMDAASVLNAELVSKKWLETATSYRVWRNIFGNEFRRRSSISYELPTHVGGYGLGKSAKKQDWKDMWKVRKALDARWKSGHAAAIYLEGHQDSVYCVQFDEDKIITGSRDRTIRVWDARTYTCIKVLGIPKTSVNHSNPPPIGDARMKGQRPHTSITPSRPEKDVTATERSMNHHGSVLCLQFDKEIMVTGSSDTTLIVWDITKDYQSTHRLERHSAGVLDVCFDAKHIVSCSKDTTICLWDRESGNLLRTLNGHRGPVNAVQLRGNLVVSASGDAFAKLWDIASGNCIKEFASKDRGLACVEFSPDSRTILVGGNDQVIYQFDANTGELVRELTGHTSLVRSLHLDSVNKRVISGSYDYSVKAFDAEDGSMLCDFAGWTTSWMLSAKADYRRIVATSQDGRAVIMDFGYDLKGIELLES